MSSASANSSFAAYGEQWRSESGLRLTEHIYNIGHFFFRLRTQLRYGELTRAPLELLRFQLMADTIECDWLARLPDPWDVELPPRMRQRHATLQALRDAIDVRELLFRAVTGAQTAYIQVYREGSGRSREMIINGCTQRNDHSARGVHSLSMRAKVLGFRFRLEDDTLCSLPGGDMPIPAVRFSTY